MRSEVTYHRDFPFEESYEGLARALSLRKEPAQARVVECKELTGGRFMVHCPLGSILKARPQEGCVVTFPGCDGIKGKVAKVDDGRDYVIVSTVHPLRELRPQKISFHPTDFLNKLRRWAAAQSGPLPRWPFAPLPWSLSPAHLRQLRTAQQQALKQAGQGELFLWGPPGTGKTFTVGRLVLSLVDQGFRVLLMAPTNVAVDQAVLSIDDAFQQCGSPLAPGQLVRTGYPQVAELEEQREHLLAWQASYKEMAQQAQAQRRKLKDLNRKLNQAQRPSERAGIEDQIVQVGDLLDKIVQQRSAAMWQLVERCQILACTIHSGIQKGEVAALLSHRKVAVVFDEAGMVPRFAPIPILAMVRGEEGPAETAPSARPRELMMVYSGDPMQLAPIAFLGDGRDVNARRWLADSLMESPPDEAVLLDEQSRMDPAICQVVSRTYYQERLKTVDDPKRLRAPLAPGWPARALVLVPPKRAPYLEVPGALPELWASEATFNERNLWVAAYFIERALQHNPDLKVLWLTPFRKQATKARELVSFYFSEGQRVTAGTVHVSQGSEADLVIFDPVKPGHGWIKSQYGNPKDIDRMLNVAISRARSQVFILASRNEIRKTPAFWKLFHEVEEWFPGR